MKILSKKETITTRSYLYALKQNYIQCKKSIEMKCKELGKTDDYDKKYIDLCNRNINSLSQLISKLS